MNIPHIISLIDLTSLNSNDTVEVIADLCSKANTPLSNVAAVCIYPQFITLAKKLLQHTPVQVATVVNFPEGNSSLSQVAKEIEHALTADVDEIDLVIPYQDCLAGNYQTTKTLIKTAKNLCQDKYLKVIIEAGALVEAKLIYQTSCYVLEVGADFIKTSTGKIAIGATMTAAKEMLKAIQSVNPNAGLKVSGGIKTLLQAQEYIQLVHDTMSEAWCTPQHFRIGASSLLDALLTM